MYLDRQSYTVFWPYMICRPNTKTKISRTSTHTRSVFFFLHVAIRNSLRSNNIIAQNATPCGNLKQPWYFCCHCCCSRAGVEIPADNRSRPHLFEKAFLPTNASGRKEEAASVLADTRSLNCLTPRIDNNFQTPFWGAVLSAFICRRVYECVRTSLDCRILGARYRLCRCP